MFLELFWQNQQKTFFKSRHLRSMTAPKLCFHRPSISSGHQKIYFCPSKWIKKSIFSLRNWKNDFFQKTWNLWFVWTLVVVKTVVLVTRTVSDPMRQFVLHRTCSSSVCMHQQASQKIVVEILKLKHNVSLLAALAFLMPNYLIRRISRNRLVND